MNTQKTDMPVLKIKDCRMPVLGLGTWELKGELCRTGVRTALELGYRHIDTARMYGNEEYVGRGIKDAGINREEFFLTTKIAPGNLHPDGIRREASESLKLLQMDYVDLLLVHWPDDAVPIEKTLAAMRDLQEEGKVRHLGVSNFTVEWLEKTRRVDVELVCNQVEYHVYLSQAPVMEWVREQEMALVAYSPLARGKAVEDDTLSEIGKRYGKSAAQVALRWLIQQNRVAAIPKGTSEDHIRANMEIFDFDLNEDEMKRISGLGEHGRVIDPPFAPDWDT